MPTTKARLNLTLPDDVANAVEKLSRAWGKSKTTIVTDILVAALPQMDALARLAKTMHVSPLAGIAELEAMAVDVHRQVAQQTLELGEWRAVEKAKKRKSK